jgi:GT2 family glycosyltransferase
MFVPFEPRVRVCLTVVTLGTPPRLLTCLEALRRHESRHDFTVALVLNADTQDGVHQLPDGMTELVEGLALDLAPTNVGWPGGLHRARALTDAELLVWVQDDMLPEAGWLDALVDAADAHPEIGGFGSVRVDDSGRVIVTNAGRAEPPGAVAQWNDTDITAENLPTEVTTYDWVTSKGFLTRTAVFDEVGGPDPRLWPLNHVDKDYCTHLRCHGYAVALAPGARLQHTGSQSSPTTLRSFLNVWRETWFDQHWHGPLEALEGRTAAVVPHPCADWRTDAASAPLDAVSAVVGLEAGRMLVPLSRYADRERAAAEDVLEAQIVALRAQAYQLSVDADSAASRAGWLEEHAAGQERQLAHQAEILAAAEAAGDRARRRARTSRQRLRALEQSLERSLTWRVTRRLRRLSRRPG